MATTQYTNNSDGATYRIYLKLKGHSSNFSWEGQHTPFRTPLEEKCLNKSSQSFSFGDYIFLKVSLCWGCRLWNVTRGKETGLNRYWAVLFVLLLSQAVSQSCNFAGGERLSDDAAKAPRKRTTGSSHWQKTWKDTNQFCELVKDCI